MATENEYLDGDFDAMCIGTEGGDAAKKGAAMAQAERKLKYKVGDVIVGKTIGGWGFGKARITSVMGYAVEGNNETYKAVVLEATENFKGGESITVKDFDTALYRGAVLGSQQPSNEVPKGWGVGVPESQRLDTIHANGKVWKIKPLAEAVLRKMQPVGTLLKEYFPLARRGEAAVAWVGNEKHNPGEPLHWAKDKSNDHLDCAGRHLSESDDWDVTVLPDGRAFAVLHAAQLAWRASALAEIAAEKYGGCVIFQVEVPQAK